MHYFIYLFIYLSLRAFYHAVICEILTTGRFLIYLLKTQILGFGTYCWNENKRTLGNGEIEGAGGLYEIFP